MGLSCVKENHVIDNICQYIKGPIAIDDWARLRDRTLRVSKFILTDVTKGKSEARISPAAYFRLALSQEPGIPLFPRLSDLVIVDADASLSYLELLLTPSLTSLEVSHIPNAKQPTLFSFLTTLANVAPYLQALTFGPGWFPSLSVQTIIQFKNLRQLELKYAVSRLSFAFLESLGSSSPALESLILDARSCEYIPSTPITSNGLSKSIEEHTLPASFDGTHRQKRQRLSAKPDVGDTFSQLMKLHVIGSLLFLGDLILQIASTKLEDISITVIKEELEIEKVKIKREAKKEMEAEGIAQTGKQTKRSRMQRAKSEREKEKSELEALPLSGMWLIWLGELEGESMEERRIRDTNEQKKAWEANDILFSALLQLLPSRWSTSLKTVSVVNLGHSPQALIAPTLFNEAFRLLLFHPTIKNLTAKGWTPDSVEDSVLGLAELAPWPPSNLETLFLPLDEANSGISWSNLRHIAIRCPKLRSLQCRIKPQSLIPNYTDPAAVEASEALFHGLRTISLGNSSPDLHSNKHHLIARHLDLLFPHLETITTFEHNDAEAEPWIVVHELVKMCQAARVDERHRAIAIQHWQS